MEGYGEAVTDNDLENLVRELRSTIEGSASLAGDERTKLEDLAQRIEQQVDDEHGLIENIADSVGLFETDHPALVQTLNRIAQTLNASGI